MDKEDDTFSRAPAQVLVLVEEENCSFFVCLFVFFPKLGVRGD